jgi:DNA-binding NtrC family response regulator
MTSGYEGRILIVDDEVGILRGLSDFFECEGYVVHAKQDIPGAMKIVEDFDIDIAIVDIRLKHDESGTDLLAVLKERDSDLPVVMITGFGSVESAVDAMHAGAADYILKPIDNSHLLEKVRRNIELVRLKQDNQYLSSELREKYCASDVVTANPAMLHQLELADKVKQSNVPVLLCGESGTGKEIVARYIHFTGNRKDRPFICVNCAALSESLLLSELFGHEKGAFTGAFGKRLGKFELADTGTLFLDEIGDMSLDVQAKLLRVLERSCFERLGGSRSVSVDIRIISATNKPVVQLVREGKLRTDLYYRINVVRLELPPLRERREDIPLLAQHFIQQYNQRYRKHIKGVADSVMRAWMDYRWPGNVRELQNVVNQGVLLSAPGQNELMAVPYPGASPQIVQDNIFDPNLHDSLESCVRQTVQELEKASIERILGTCSYNQSKTAEILHITRKTLAKKMHDYGIRRM